MFETKFLNYRDSIFDILNQLQFDKRVQEIKPILIKPNVVNNNPFPITSHPDIVHAIIQYIRSFSDVEILVGDGGGMPEYSTFHSYKALGYTSLNELPNVKLIDLNEVECQRYEIKDALVHREMHLPKLIDTHYIISVAVLKAHSLADVTGVIKNMMGLLPPEHYRGKYGIWNKAVFHHRMHDSLVDMYRYMKPDLSIMDASVGLSEFHLGGPTCNPPVGKLLAGYDALDIDKRASELLGMNWQDIDYIKKLDKLGRL